MISALKPIPCWLLMPVEVIWRTIESSRLTRATPGEAEDAMMVARSRGSEVGDGWEVIFVVRGEETE